jgi:site-specific recombinase XerD
VSHFTAALVEEWFLHLDSRDLARKTLAIYQTALREFAKWGLKRRYWRDDPLLDVPVITYPKNLPRPFTAAERDALMALCRSTSARCVRCSTTPVCAMRPSAAFAGLRQAPHHWQGR